MEKKSMMLPIKQKLPVFENMWTIKNDRVHLIGSLCTDCREIYFPRKEIQICSYCQSQNICDTDIGNEGIIHSYTVVHQMPAGGYYKGTVPFIYAIIEMPIGVYVQTHLINTDPEKIKIGDRYKAVLDTLYEENNVDIITYKFEPVKL